MLKSSNIVLNSTLAYLIAFLATTINHELSHALIGVIFKSKPVLHHNYVEHLAVDELGVWPQVLIAMAGPFSSLCQGIVASLVVMEFEKQTLLKLFLLWFSILGLSNFFGYLLTGPIFANGDIGKVYLLLEVPMGLAVVGCLFSVFVLLFIMLKVSRPFLEFANEPIWLENGKMKKQFALLMIILPWIIGSLIMSILYLPIVALASIIYPVMSGFMFIYPWQNAQRITGVQISNEDYISSLSIPFLGISVFVVLIFKLVLAPGIKFFA